MTSKVISKEELFSNKKNLQINTSDLDSQQDYCNNDENNPNQMNMSSQMMGYGYQQGKMDQFVQQKYQQNYYKQPYMKVPDRSFNGNMGQMMKPQMDELSIIQSLKYVSDKYPQLLESNKKSSGILSAVQNQASPRFVVIKSFTEEDIHKSIKYNCWSSTREGNKKLNNLYLECKSKNSDLYLFFSMNGSGRFVGVAKMTSEVDENMIFEYWAMDGVWKGLFEVEWVFIKDVPNRFLKEIKLSNNAFKPVSNSRDTQEIPRNEGEMFLRIFDEFKYHTCLLQHFQYYDERQDMFEISRLQK